MSVEVRNLQSGETFEVGPDGAIFGREGGPANIKVPDQSVSKRHARIFSDGSDWFLEDMGSVNGTLVDGGKIGGTLPLKAGIIFQMSKFRFEVLSIDGRGPRGGTPELETRTALRGNTQGSPQGGANLPSELRKDPIPKRRAAREPPPPVENTNQQRPANFPPASDGDFPSQVDAAGNDVPDDDAPRPVLGIDSYDDDTGPGGALGMGIGYVLKTAPLLVLNPLGTVRKQVENPPLPGLQKLPLAFLLLPAYALTFVAQALVGGLAGIIAGGPLQIVALLLGPVIAAVVALVGAVIAGFLAHPILGWLVDKLGGSSDTQARTTHIAMGMTTTLVLLAPTMLATLLTAIAARLASISPAFALINVVPALLMIIATPLPVFVQWSWFRSYNVAKWFQTLLLVLAILGVLGGIAGAVGTVLGAVATLKAGTGAGGAGLVVPPVPGVEPVAGTDPTLAKDPTGTNPSDPTDTNPSGTNPSGTNPTGPNPTGPNPTGANPTGPTPTKEPLVTSATKTPPAGEYGDYLRKRAAIEAALEKDPTLVQSKRIGPLYERLSRETYNAEQEAVLLVLGPKKKPDPGKRAYLEKMKIAFVFQQTRGIVDDLFKALPQ